MAGAGSGACSARPRQTLDVTTRSLPRMNDDLAGAGGAHRLLDKAGERAEERHQRGALVLKHLPDRALSELGMTGAPGIGDALVRKPAIELVERLHLRAGSEQQVAHGADLVLDLALLPARRRRAGDRIDEVVRAQLQEALIVDAGAADKYGVDRRLH